MSITFTGMEKSYKDKYSLKRAMELESFFDKE